MDLQKVKDAAQDLLLFYFLKIEMIQIKTILQL